TKLKEDFKELESQSFKRDLLDKTKPLRKAEKEELTSEVLEQVQKENLKLYLNDTSGNLTKFLNAKKPFKITMRGANIKHILNRHGENSTLAKNGQPFVNLEDIKKYDEIINNADRQILKENDKGEKTLLSGKQINGHYIVISSVRLKNGELKLKTMYKENGKLENDKAFKSVKLPSETPSVLRGQSLTTDLDGYPSHADESIAQNSQEAKIKEAVKNHNAIYKEILDNDYIFTDERSKIFRKRERELIENLAKDEKVQAFTSQWGYPFKKDGKLRGVGLDYKAKVYGKGEHKMMRVSGGGFGSATQQKKEKRLLELEKERLQEAFKADFGIDGFISKYVENGFFETLWRETSAYKGTDYGWGVDPREYYPYYENRIMPSDTITQAKEKLQKEKSNWSVKRQEAKGSEDIIFTDKKGKEHTLTKETQKAWLEAFGLKSLEEAYIPNFKAEVKEAINRVLGGEEIKLTKGSFEKLVKRDREEFLPYIKDTLEKANAVIKQVDGALIFAKDYRNERLGKFFASVSRNDEGEWIITSNAPKNLNNLKNKLNEGGELLYSDLPELTIIAKPDLDANALNSEANLKDIIPQKANLEAVNKQKDKEFLEAYEKADFKGKVELAKQDIDEEIKFLEKQKEEFKRIIQQKDYNDIELEQARKILENAKEEVEGHYRIKYMQNGKEMRAYISKTDYFNQGKILSKDEILHKIIQKTIYKDKIENIKKTSDKLKKQIKIIDEYLKEYGDNEAGAISDDIIEKFKYYDFAKNAGKGAVIIGERRKGLYEQAQKVLNSRFLKAKKRATQSKKNYNITYDEARKLFYKGDMSEEQKELFQSVLPIAQKLNVRIRTAIREPYEDMIKDTTNIAGMYRYELNTATLKKGGNYTDTQRAETLLHELIHSVTSRAMSLHKTPLRDKMLSKTQIKAIDEIDQIYKKLYKFKKTFKLQDENGADLYGIKNSHEMLAELANPMFSSKLKEIGLYEKLVNNIMKIILSVRDFIRLRSDKNVYEKLKQCLKDIIENYKDDFTQEYEKQNIRDFTLTSQTQKEQIYTQRQEIKNTLKAKINQAITNENTGEKAILTNKGISKMLSDKAISKSVDNGFSREEHLRAVGVVDELFKRAKRAFSKRDEKDKNLSIYRYNAPFKNANALMTLKEYKQNGKRIYSLELENLEAAKFNPSGKDLAEQLSKSKDADTTTFHTPIDNPDESIAQKSDNIYHSNPHLGAGLVGGVLNGVEQDENGNLSFDPVKFAMGFLGGSGGSFALKKGFQILEKNPELKEKIINELAHTLAQGFEKAREKYSLLSLLEPRYIVKNEKGRKIQAKTMLKELEREQKGLYNVAFNGKNAVLIKKDLEAVDEAILFEKGTKRKGGKHIRLAHSTEPSQEGYVTKQEVANLGVNIREYLKNYEPFIDKNGARLYEWKDENGVKFRAVVNNTQTSGGNSHLPSASEEIITFYSDRNLKEKMNFKNPLLKDTIAE
ncbi:PBECR2 nuclease fold domain-containing protein, partial [Campylobacter upsaliensis]